MPSAKLLIGGAAALAALFGRRGRRRPERGSEPKPEAEPAEADELGDEEVRELREELRRELERLAGADIKASRTRRESTPPG
jgi:hypothetical protein